MTTPENQAEAEAIEALWNVVDRLKAIADSLDPISAELTKVPSGAGALMIKLFSQLQDIHTLGTDTQMSVEKLLKVHQAQDDRLLQVEQMTAQLHQRLMTTVARD